MNKYQVELDVEVEVLAEVEMGTSKLVAAVKSYDGGEEKLTFYTRLASGRTAPCHRSPKSLLPQLVKQLAAHG